MPDYKKMYLHMAHEVERAVRILTEVQQECEDIYIDSADDPVIMIPLPSSQADPDEKTPPR